MIKTPRIEFKQPDWSLEDFYYYECPTRAITEKHFNYYKKSSSFWDLLDYPRYLQALSEHDAAHYLMGLRFSEVDEKRVVTVEMACNVGWWAADPRYNSFYKSRIKFDLPKGLGRTLILQTAERIRDLY